MCIRDSYGNQGGDPSAIVRQGKWKLIKYFENNNYELYDIINDYGEKKDVSDLFPEISTSLKNILEEWLLSTNAKIPEIDPIYNEEQEIKWRAANKIKYKLRFEKQRKEELKLTYLPNEDWWGSYLE